MQRLLERKNLIGLIYTVLFVTFMGYGLYQKGLFFAPYKTYAATAVVIVGFVGLVVTLIRRRFRAPVWLLFMYGYTGYALLSTTWSASPSLAIGGAVMLASIALAMTFVPLLTLLWRRILLSIIAFSGAVLYLFGMAAEFGLVHYTDAIQQNMMDSVFQYHNAFGSYELAAALVSILLGTDASRYVMRVLYYLMATFSLLGVVASYSRWVWIATVLMIVAVLFVSRMSPRKLNSFLYTGFILLTAVVAAPFTIKAVHHTSKSGFVIGTGVAIVAALAVPFALRWLDKVAAPSKRIGIAVAAIVIPFVAGVAVLLEQKSALTSILQRVHTIQFNDTSLQSRFWFYGAAVHMWQSNPLFGSGYQTWTAKFQAFEQFTYWSTMTHSYFFSQLVDFGLIGTLLWLGVLATAVFWIAQGLRGNEGDRIVSLAAVFGSSSLLLHTIFDFDFDFPVILMVFFLLLAIGTKYDDGEKLQSEPRSVRMPMAILGSLFGLITGVLGLGLSVSDAVVNHTTAAKTRTDQLRLAHRALAFAPYNVDAQLDLAQLYFTQYQQSHAQADKDNAMKYAAQAERTGYWDPKLQKTVATIAYQTGNFPQAATWAQRASIDGPMTLQYPSAFMGIALWIGAVEYAKNPTYSQQLFQSIVDTYSQLNERIQFMKTLPPDVASYESWQLQIDAPTEVYAAAAEYGLGHYQQSINDLHYLVKTNQDQNTLGLYEIVALLDEAKLGQGTIADIPRELTVNNSILPQELKVLSAIHP